jgi:hypothetical protein
MNRYIKDRFAALNPRQRQWTWFIALWFGGAGAMLALSMIIKLMIGV